MSSQKNAAIHPTLKLLQRATIHPLYNLWGLLPRKTRHISLEMGQLVVGTKKRLINIPIGDIQNLRVSNGWFFSRLDITADATNHQLKGFSAAELTAFVAAVQRLALDVLQHSGEWRALIQSANSYQNGMHYFSSHEWQRLAELMPLKQRLNALAIDAEFITREGANPVAKLAIALSQDDISELARNSFNQQVVPRLLETFEPFFDQVESQPLSQPQRIACVTDDDHTLVIAGAGTGKTSTIIGKAGYLLRSGLAQPDNILLLAFGNKAAREMAERIERRLPDVGANLKATTFHAFGNRIVARTQGEKRALTRFAEQPGELRKFIEDIIEKQLAENDDYKIQLVKYFVCYSTPGRCEYDFETIEEYHEFLESCRLITLKGEFVKSVGELRVANYLHLYSVPYQYEASYAINTATIARRQYKPDFYLSRSNLYLEYLGLDRQMRTAPFVNQASYLESLAWKRETHRKNGTLLAELYSYQLSEGTLEQDLLRILKEASEPLMLQDMDTMLLDLKESSISPWQGFIDLLLRFLSLFKEGQFTFDGMEEQMKRVDVGRTQAFLALFRPVFDAYQEQLATQGEMDFSDMIAEATKALLEDRFRHHYDYVLVDEFQDLSGGRSKLLRALLDSRPNMRLFAVGDDWQSIYRFNGSDLRFFTRFDHQFSPAKMLPLDKSYRFNNRIHELSASFVTRNPAQLKKNITTHAQVEHPAVQLLDIQEMMSKTQASAKRDKNTEACVLQLRKALSRCNAREQRLNRAGRAPVMLIGRYRAANMPAVQSLDFKALAREYPCLEISYQTAHASKGLEADYVIILGLEKGNFPSTRENDELIDLLLPEHEDYLFAEERRLMYVAITRARHYVFMVFDSQNASTFALEIAGMGSRFIAHHEALELGQWSCTGCNTGKLVAKTSRHDKKFYICSLAPACDVMTNACRQCGSPMLVQGGMLRICANESCGEKEMGCRRCGIGIMLQRKNKQGVPFYGCNRYRSDAEDCCYEKISNEEYHNRIASLV
ncbi:UvrD-helicase domain-containing protein [Pseudomonas graminis]